MKGLQPLFLGIFGIFAFSWLGMTVVPNLQIGGLDPQTDEEGADVYPAPPSGMAIRGAQVYAANGCVYCHTQQVRPDYGGSDLERKWGDRRSAPRDYMFQPVVMLGKMRTGPDLANVGHRPTLDEKGAASPAPAQGATAGAPATAGTAPAAGANPAAAPAETAPTGSAPAAATASTSPAPAGSPAASANAVAAASPAALAVPVQPATTSAPPPDAAAAPATAAAASPAPATSPAAVAAAGGSPAPSPTAGASGVLPAAGDQPAANVATSAPSMVADPKELTADGQPTPYTAAWHHRHLYDPRSVAQDSNMPAYRFLYEKRRISGQRSPDSINFAGAKHEHLESGWEIVPSYDAKCLVAYLMSLDQSHALKEAKSPVALAPAPGKEAQK